MTLKSAINQLNIHHVTHYDITIAHYPQVRTGKPWDGVQELVSN